MGDATVKLPRLGKRQWEMLGKIVRTNGGGIYVYYSIQKTVLRLHELGLVQGKAGQQYCAVHTREGLEAWRAYQRATKPQEAEHGR